MAVMRMARRMTAMIANWTMLARSVNIVPAILQATVTLADDTTASQTSRAARGMAQNSRTYGQRVSDTLIAVEAAVHRLRCRRDLCESHEQRVSAVVSKD